MEIALSKLSKPTVLVLSGPVDTVDRALHLLAPGMTDGLKAECIGIQEIDGANIRFGIDLDGLAVDAMIEPNPDAVAIANFARYPGLRADGQRFGMLAVNVEIDGEFDLPTLLAGNRTGMDGLIALYGKLDVDSNIGGILDSADRTQRVLVFAIGDDGVVLGNGSGYKLAELLNNHVVDFAIQGETIDITTTTHGGTFDGLTATEAVNYDELGIKFPARRITVAPDGTKVVTFVDFDADTAYTQTFTPKWEMVGGLTEVEGSYLRIDGDTATYQAKDGSGFGKTSWTAPVTPAS